MFKPKEKGKDLIVSISDGMKFEDPDNPNAWVSSDKNEVSLKNCA